MASKAAGEPHLLATIQLVNQHCVDMVQVVKGIAFWVVTLSPLGPLHTCAANSPTLSGTRARSRSSVYLKAPGPSKLVFKHFVLLRYMLVSNGGGMEHSGPVSRSMTWMSRLHRPRTVTKNCRSSTCPRSDTARRQDCKGAIWFIEAPTAGSASRFNRTRTYVETLQSNWFACVCVCVYLFVCDCVSPVPLLSIG